MFNLCQGVCLICSVKLLHNTKIRITTKAISTTDRGLVGSTDSAYITVYECSLCN